MAKYTYDNSGIVDDHQFGMNIQQFRDVSEVAHQLKGMTIHGHNLRAQFLLLRTFPQLIRQGCLVIKHVLRHAVANKFVITNLFRGALPSPNDFFGGLLCLRYGNLIAKSLESS